MARPFPQKLRPLQRLVLLALAVLITVVGLHPATPAMPRAAPAAPAAQEELRGVWLTANDMPVLRDQTRMEATVNIINIKFCLNRFLIIKRFRFLQRIISLIVAS